MVNAGLIPATIVDDYIAAFWKKVFPNLTVHEQVAVRTGGTLAIAIRKNSPQLAAALNTFMGNTGWEPRSATRSSASTWSARRT